MIRHPYEETCAVCRRHIVPGADFVFANIKYLGVGDLSAYQGQFVEVFFPATKRCALAVVTTQESVARKEGYKLVAVCCSEQCAELIRIEVASTNSFEIHEIVKNEELN